MNTKSIVAALMVLGTSTVALAAPCEPTAPAGNVHTVYQPPQSTSNNWGHGPVVAQTRPVIYHPIAIKQPVLVANDAQFRKDNRAFIDVGASVGQFDKLTIKAENGRTYVRQVAVMFTDGSEKVLRNLNTNIDGGHSLTLNVSDCAESIKQIVVYGTGTSVGYRHQPATFDITLL